MCESSFVASAMSKSISLMGKSYIEPQCKTNRITITKDRSGETGYGGIYMKLNTKYASTLPDKWLKFRTVYDQVKEWNEDPEIDDIYNFPYFEEEDIEPSDNPNEEELYRITARYNMDKIIADEMKRCWDIVGQGELDLFDNWFRFMDCKAEDGGPTECDSLLDALKSFVGLEEGQFRAARNFCVLCSRIKFDEEVKADFTGSSYDSINRWMGNHPWRLGERESYREYLLGGADGIDDEEIDFFTIQQYHYDTQRPYAVVFIRLNFHQAIITPTRAMDVVADIISGVDVTIPIINQDIDPEIDIIEDDGIFHANVLALMPYEQIPNSCDYIVGAYI